MIFRDASPADDAVVLALLRQIAVEADEPEYGPGSSDAKMFEVIDQCRTKLLELDGAVIGICAVRLIDLSSRPEPACRKLAFIMAFGIDRSARRRGHGTALFEHMRAWLRAEGADLVSLNVSARNHAARDFYARMGLREGSVQMEMRLQPPPRTKPPEPSK